MTGKYGNIQDRARQNKTEQDRSRHDRTRQDKIGLDRTRQDYTGQDTTGQDTTRHDETGKDMTRQDITGQDRTLQDKTELLSVLDAQHPILYETLYVSRTEVHKRRHSDARQTLTRRNRANTAKPYC